MTRTGAQLAHARADWVPGSSRVVGGRRAPYRFVMAWTTTQRAERFLDVAGPLLREDAASNTVLLTAAASVATSGPKIYGDEPPLFGWWASADGRVDGAFIHTPPFPAQLTALPAAAVDPLAELLAGSGRPLAGVGPAPRRAAPTSRPPPTRRSCARVWNSSRARPAR